jgi:hypothetical protein
MQNLCVHHQQPSTSTLSKPSSPFSSCDFMRSLMASLRALSWPILRVSHAEKHSFLLFAQNMRQGVAGGSVKAQCCLHVSLTATFPCPFCPDPFCSRFALSQRRAAGCLGSSSMQLRPQTAATLAMHITLWYCIALRGSIGDLQSLACRVTCTSAQCHKKETCCV